MSHKELQLIITDGRDGIIMYYDPAVHVYKVLASIIRFYRNRGPNYRVIASWCWRVK